MSEGPKLYTNKPKKAQLKQYQQQQASAPSSMASSGSSTVSQAATTAPLPPPPPPPPKPPQPPKESFARRYRFLWPLLLVVNFTVGAYLFTRTKKKDVATDEAGDHDVPTTPDANAATVTEKSPILPPVMEPAKLRAPISEDQQRELFKWMLEEKRKMKPKDPEEKKRIDEEKAILKQFIRAKSIPNL
ncbi:hypothetical protein Adt_00122 [Abeliophyllum distichum]|uniref:Uncharacterized protein n=1 Tax=Abeliophyllum distichum TaxID=126358 RepID=A0ABD1VP56_9LAMI